MGDSAVGSDFLRFSLIQKLTHVILFLLEVMRAFQSACELTNILSKVRWMSERLIKLKQNETSASE